MRCWASPGSEADDLAATLAVKVAQAGHQATIVSTDKGYCQLLSPTIRIRDYFQKRWLDAPLHRQRVRRHPGAAGGLLGGWRGSAARRCRAWRALDPKAPPSC
ncbi:hypothetical protein P4W01_05985 [Klebsiella pneumoniae]|nr:hypothetical protein [Klebsiella pneumoniae]